MHEGCASCARQQAILTDRLGGAGKLRSADCIAEGKVTAVALSKQAFVAMDNPLLSWMLDYDAVAGVLSVSLCLLAAVQAVLLSAHWCRVLCAMPPCDHSTAHVVRGHAADAFLMLHMSASACAPLLVITLMTQTSCVTSSEQAPGRLAAGMWPTMATCKAQPATDNVLACVQTCETPTAVSEEKLDAAIELFEREEVGSGKVIVAEGSIHNRLYIVRGGAVVASTAEGQKANLQEAGGFTFFGDQAILVSPREMEPLDDDFHMCVVSAGLWLIRPAH